MDGFSCVLLRILLVYYQQFRKNTWILHSNFGIWTITFWVWQHATFAYQKSDPPCDHWSLLLNSEPRRIQKALCKKYRQIWHKLWDLPDITCPTHFRSILPGLLPGLASPRVSAEVAREAWPYENSLRKPAHLWLGAWIQVAWGSSQTNTTLKNDLKRLKWFERVGLRRRHLVRDSFAKHFYWATLWHGWKPSIIKKLSMVQEQNVKLRWSE